MNNSIQPLNLRLYLHEILETLHYCDFWINEIQELLDSKISYHTIPKEPISFIREFANRYYELLDLPIYY